MAAINFTANMTEVERISLASGMTSCFNGNDDVEVGELRQVRNVIFKDRRRLIDEYARIRQLEEDEFDTDAPDYDLSRLRWLKNVHEYVRHAKELFESGRISHDTLVAAASALDKMTECWNKTAYLIKDNPNHALRMPTKDDFLKPTPQPGEKRNISDFSIATGTLAVIPPGKVPFPRTSSPNPPAASLQINEVAMQPQPTTPTALAAHDPAVQRWVNTVDPATPPPTAPLPAAKSGVGSGGRTRMLEASRARREAEECRKERDNLRQVVAQNEEQHQRQIAETIAKTKAEVTAAANAAFDREMEQRSKQEKERDERARVAINNAQDSAANAQLAAQHARQEAQKSGQELADAHALILRHQQDMQRQEQENRRMAAEMEAKKKEMDDALRAANERIKQVEQTAQQFRTRAFENEKELEKEREARSTMLPSETPANDHTPLKRVSPPKQRKGQRQHPLHEGLQRRQQKSPSNEQCKSVRFQTQSPPSSTPSETNADVTLDIDNSKSDEYCVRNTKTDVTYEYGDTYVRCKQLHVEQMRSARPASTFSTGNPTEYSVHLNAFRHATRHQTITDEDRMDELVHWFSGDALKVVRLHQLDPNPSSGYRKVIEELDALFKETQDSFGATIRTIIRGKPLNKDSHQEHLRLYTKLREAQSVVERSGCRSAAYEFNRRDIIRDILNSRLPHMAERFWREDVKSTKEKGKPWAFDELLEEIKDWMRVLRGANPEGFAAENAKKSSIAAVSATQGSAPGNTYASRLINSPPKVQQTTTCNECGGLHETAACNVLLAMNVEQRVEALTKKGLCYHCFSHGHRASSCTQRPTCGKCSRKHATMLHERKFDSPKKKSSVSASALPFRPFAGSATTPQNGAASTAAGDASAQQESVL